MADPTEQLHQMMPLGATLDIRAVTWGKDEVVLAVDWAPRLCTSGGLLHGGVLMALADAAGCTDPHRTRGAVP